jgi:hypothetical protein
LGWERIGVVEIAGGARTPGWGLQIAKCKMKNEN